MAKPSTKRSSKPSKPTSSSPLLPPQSPPRYPFTTPSPQLATFLSTLAPTHLYILHTDTFPARHKRLIFAVPLLLNILLTLLLLWRAHAAIPAYAAIFLATLGFDSDANIDTARVGWAAMMEIGARRTGMFFFDFTLVRFVVGWPLDFFYWKSPAGPVRWRYEVGFLEREIVVRRSRRWDRGVVGVEEEKKKKEEEKEEEGGGGAVFRGEGWLGEELYRERVLPGLERAWVEGRTGYAMMDKNWDLDFDAMITAHRSLRSRTLRWEDLSSRKLAVHHPDRGWLVYSPDASLRRGEEVAEKGDVESVRRRLKDLGKENLFWKWMDVVQGVGMGMGVGVGTGMEKERSEKRKSMDRKVRDLFEREGVDFDAFWGLRGGDAEVVDTGSI